MPTHGKPLLGELLLRDGLVSPAQLAEALRKQKENGKRLGRIFLDTGVLTREQLEKMLARQRKESGTRQGR